MTLPPFLFGGFQFDPATGELTGPTGSTRLGPQAAQILAILLQRRGELVTRADLKDALWGGSAVEADMGINTCIRQIRSALGEDAEQGRFIQTLPRRGYRFVATLDDAVPPPKRDAPRGSWRWGGALLLTGITFAVMLLRRSEQAHDPPYKVAILPLVAQAGDPVWVNEFAPQVAYRLVEKLASANDSIGVVGPATTARWASDTTAHTVLGRELGVGYVMSGIVRASDSTVFFQVIRVSDGVHVYFMRRRIFAQSMDSMTAFVANGAARKVSGR
jgi:DNA-binding winged helix-turn-helix (wHTH) protein/TolB-like protein